MAEADSLNFVLLGARAAGKTTYLATLFAEEPTITAADAASITYLRDEWSLIREGRDHPTRLSLRELRFLYKTPTLKVAFSIDDYDGQFAESLGTIDETAPDYVHSARERETLKEKIRASDGLLFLFPWESRLNEQAARNFRNEINTYIRLVNEVYPSQTSLPTPVVLGVTKWDRSPHFAHEDEIDHAGAYIESVAEFRQARRQIETFFRSVTVVPISAFGPIPEGRRPDGNAIHPHNLTRPFDCFLEHGIRRFRDQVAALQAAGNLPGLYEYLERRRGLAELLDDGAFGRLRQETERSYAQKVISALERARTAGQRATLTEEHRPLFERVRDRGLARRLDEAIRHGRGRQRVRALGRALMTLAVLGVVGAGAALFFWVAAEREAFERATRADGLYGPAELIANADRYLGAYGLHPSIRRLLELAALPAGLELPDIGLGAELGKLGLPELALADLGLPSLGLPRLEDTLARRRDQVEQVRRRGLAALERDLRTELEQLRARAAASPTEDHQDVLVMVEQLRGRAAAYPDLVLGAEIDRVVQWLTTLADRRRELERLVGEARMLVDTGVEDRARFDPVIARLGDLAHDGDPLALARKDAVVAAQQALLLRLKELEGVERRRVRQELLNRANALLEAATTDRGALESVLGDLAGYESDSTLADTRRRLAERMGELGRNERFTALYQAVLAADTIAGMRLAIEQAWPAGGFTETQRDRLLPLLDGKIAVAERRLVGALPTDVHANDALTQVRQTLAELEQAEVALPVINYRYQGRPPEVQRRVDAARETLSRFGSVTSEGVTIRSVTLAIDDRRNPLGLNCPLRGGSEGRVTIAGTVFDQASAECEYMASGQTMRWTTELALSAGRQPIELREINTGLTNLFGAGDEVLAADIPVTADDLVLLAQGKTKVYRFPAGYELRLTAGGGHG